MMIGQQKNLEYIDNLREVPHFLVFIGSLGSGKTTLAKYVADKLSATFSLVGIKVDEIREVIDTAYRVRENVVYCIKDADNMRAEAKNAMLKITEEPPENAYFILTVQDAGSLLDTIRSRAILINMEGYKSDEIREYLVAKYKNPGTDIELVTSIASNMYEADIVMSYGIDFIGYVQLVIDNIADVELANSFKSGNKIALKDDPDKYDLKIFLQTFLTLCLDGAVDATLEKNYPETIRLCGFIQKTLPILSQVSRLGVNKQQLYDKWIIDIRS